ncbi:hypothetical protein Ctob_012497 [Chrysochromulina tobinii]|jgi:hypothetical protein|uniref:Uncharacterized protein n=1 Tax=Chrysochromulina tobinii TaxID=1460289 RepID=A0A0M0JVH4_9EUKA|nr:hypothetical protein Ctob_012497 [Chrysochromulina tobinii]|eukprot:KOO30123.1 hypothetical protein Ctob_012497 [Chrysochromulina sp. CCMP291]
MGGSSSRELEAAQSQVRRLTGELQKASQQLKVQQSGAALKLAAEAAEQQLKKELQAKSQLLEKTTGELSTLRGVSAELPRFKQEVAAAKEAEMRARRAEADKGVLVSELQAQLMQSKADLEQLFGKLKFAEAEKGATLRKSASVSEDRRLLADQQREAAEASARLVAEASAALGSSVMGSHPVFGELIADFGYKRLYRGSPTTLWAGTMLWERQRAFRQERANLIAAAKAKSKATGWPGAIAVVERSSSGSEASAPTGHGGGTAIGTLIDGQHRLGAAHLLAQRGKLDGALASILVEVYPPMEEQGVKDLFTEINRAEPVLLVDLPEGGASDQDNAILTAAAEELAQRYPAMFKPSHGCRPPHLNVDVLRAELHRAEVLSRHKLASAAELLDWVDKANRDLGARSDEQWASTGARAKSETALGNALSKARQNAFYLGMGWDWLK